MVSKFADQVRSAAQTVESATTEQTLDDILRQRDMIAGQMLKLASSGNFGEEVLGFDDFGEPISGTSGDYKQLAALAATFDALGTLAKAKTPGGGGEGGISAAALAQLAMQERQLAESMRQFDVTEARSGREFAETMGFNREELAARREEGGLDRTAASDRLQAQLSSEEKRAAEALREDQRRNNLSSTLDLLTNQIRTGELGVAEATNRISAATNAANVQRDILADHAGKALAPGAKYYPNLGPGGPIEAMAQALGQPYVPFETTGTFPIDPNAIAAPISAAPGDSMLPRVDAAVQAAAAALAGMGVPLKAEGGPVQGPYVSGEAGPELNFPMGDGGSYVMPLRDMISRRFGQGEAGIPRGEIPGQPGGLFPGMPSLPAFDPQQWYGMLPPALRARLEALLGGNPMPATAFPGAQARIEDMSDARPEGWNWTGQPHAFTESMPARLAGNPAAEQQRAQFVQQAQQRGVIPPTAAGRGLRPPQMGLQAAARALAGM